MIVILVLLSCGWECLRIVNAIIVCSLFLDFWFFIIREDQLNQFLLSLRELGRERYQKFRMQVTEHVVVAFLRHALSLYYIP